MDGEDETERDDGADEVARDHDALAGDAIEENAGKRTGHDGGDRARDHDELLLRRAQ